jgi:transcriptional regulator with GAF, ATPase, and Fis domain
MAALLRDRYCEYAPDRLWDLLTGAPARASDTADDERGDGAGPQALQEVLEHGTDGSPRWIVVQPGAGTWATQARVAAAEARRRGYVPIAVDVYLRIRLLLAEELTTRSIVLIARPETRMESAQIALLHAVALSPRPHVLMTCPVERRHPASQSERWRVAEARAVYASRSLRAAPPMVMSSDVAKLLERASRSVDLVYAGRHASAERLLREVAAALVRRQAHTAAVATYVQLGQLLLDRGRVDAADAAFGDAAAHAERVSSALTASARVWQAAARTDGGQLSSAESLCRAALLTGMDDVERARTEATLARVLMWQGRTGEARELAFIDGPDEAAPFTAAMAIRILLENGEFFDAGRRARSLVDRTERADLATRLTGLGAHLRVLFASGDLSLANAGFQEFAALARAARSPLRLARVRLLRAQALRRAGLVSEADRELHMLGRMRAAVTPLLRTAIDRCARDPTLMGAPRHSHASPCAGVELVVLAQREEDDDRAARRVCEFILRSLRATRVELWTADEGPPTAVVTSGTGLPTTFGSRVLEAGIVIGPESVESGWEIGAPIRLGAKLIGAITTRWAADRTSPEESIRLLTLAAAVAAPRVDSLLQTKRQTVQTATAIPELVGISGAIADVRRSVVRAAAAPFSVHVEGESGVGKELVARAIHQLSPRRDRRFCDVNCAALPEDLLESELFGHTKGAFTGAVIDRAGLGEEADGGTLFLDEVADLSARAQAKLLRVVQQQEVRRVGETFSRKIDVRFVSAANRNLREEAEQRRFRQDLLYRLDVIRVVIPPLRERPEDIPPLAHHFWTAAAARVGTRATLSHAVLAALARYHWPGNVRELQNVIAALAVEAPVRGQVRAATLPAIITGVAAVQSGRLNEARSQWERRFVEVALARAGGSRTRAARELGLTRQGLLKVLVRLRLAPEQ